MSKEFKVGDRVNAYNTSNPFDEKPNVYPAQVIEVMKNGHLKLKFDRDSTYGSQVLYHPKQCRRLVPKKRKELWIRPQPFGPATLWHVCEPHDLGATLFREVVRKPK